jgi:hypothetical protein
MRTEQKCNAGSKINYNFLKETDSGFLEAQASYAIIKQKILNKHPLAERNGGHINNTEPKRVVHSCRSVKKTAYHSLL